MTLRYQLTVGSLLMLAGILLMGYSIYLFGSQPKVYIPVTAWVASIEYAMGRVWWDDARDAVSKWRSHP